MSLRLMGPSEVAEHLGISKQRVIQLRHINSKFPKPVAELKCGPIWLAEDIEQFAKIPRPVGRPKGVDYDWRRR
jgi:prophage regulatory protein